MYFISYFINPTSGFSRSRRDYVCTWDLSTKSADDITLDDTNSCQIIREVAMFSHVYRRKSKVSIVEYNRTYLVNYIESLYLFSTLDFSRK